MTTRKISVAIDEEEAQALQSMEGMDLDDDDVMAEGWRANDS